MRDSATIERIAEQLFIGAAGLTAQRLDGFETPRGYITESRVLQPAFKAALIETATLEPTRPAVSPSLKVVMPEHFNRLGTFDVSLAWPDGVAYGELKAGGDDLGHCAWDALKCATAVARGLAVCTVLVAAAPRQAWTRPKLGAELFRDADFATADLRDRYVGWFGHYERRDRQWPIRVPAHIRSTALAVSEFSVADQPWALVVARVDPIGSVWFDWPRYA